MRSSSDALAWKRRRVGSSLGVALSLIAHLLILGALAFGVRQGFEVESRPVANVELFPAWPRSIHRKPEATKPIALRKIAKPATRARPRRAFDTSAGREAPVGPPLAQPAEVRPIPPTQRLSFGCAHQAFMGLTAEERAACRDRFASRGPADHDYAEAGIDPKARVAFDTPSKAETFLRGPFLAAMPKKGCRPRVTEHDAAAFGKSQPDVTVQATCVVHF